MLATLPEDERQVILDNDPDYQQFSAEEKAEFITKLERIREEGIAISDSDSSLGVIDMSVPVLCGNGRPVAALSVPIIKRVGFEPELERIAEALRRTAQRVAEKSGLNNI